MKNAQGARYRLISSVQFVPGSLWKTTGMVGVTILIDSVYGQRDVAPSPPTDVLSVHTWKWTLNQTSVLKRIILSLLSAFVSTRYASTTSWLEASAIALGLPGRPETPERVDSSYCVMQHGYSGLPKMNSVLSGDIALFSSKHVHATNMIVLKPIKACV